MVATPHVIPQTEETPMTKIVLDSSALAKLAGIRESAVLCDEAGRAIGYFQPLAPPVGKGRDGTDPPFSEHQIRQFRQQRSGRPLGDVLADLKELA
jgi:hypothetical protein